MSRPRLVPLSRRFVPGLLAVGLFGVLAAVVLGTEFGTFAAYPEDVSITASIGYSLFDFEALQETQGVPGTEPFLVSFVLIAIVLDAALDASLVLATREGPNESVRPTAFGDVVGEPETESALASRPGQPAATDGGGSEDGPASDADDAMAGRGGGDRR